MEYLRDHGGMGYLPKPLKPWDLVVPDVVFALRPKSSSPLLACVLNLLGQDLLVLHHLLDHLVRQILLCLQLDLCTEDVLHTSEQEIKIVVHLIPTRLIPPCCLLHRREDELGLNRWLRGRRCDYTGSRANATQIDETPKGLSTTQSRRDSVIKQRRPRTASKCSTQCPKSDPIEESLSPECPIPTSNLSGEERMWATVLE